MRYVILRDDDTNALTPVECLERLYRPFLDRNLPVNLAVIPDVATDATTPEGEREGFLAVEGETSNTQHPTSNIQDQTSNIEHRTPNIEGVHARGHSMVGVVECSAVPIGSNVVLVQYLRDNPGYHIVQHGCHHDYFEFDRRSPDEISRRLDHGARLLCEAGFCKPDTFVAPHDKFSAAAYRAVQKRFRVISSGWFEWRRIPTTWRLNYISRKIRRAPHWRVGDTTLLSHPGCLLSWRRPYDSMLDEIIREIQHRKLTVLVTHWWEYFRDGQSDEAFITRLHEVAEYLAVQKDIRVVSFSDVAEGKVPLN